MGGGRDSGVRKEGPGLPAQKKKKKREGFLLQRSQAQKKRGGRWYQKYTKMIPKRYQNDTKMILKWYQYHFRIVLGSFVASVRWGHGRVWGERVGDRSVPAGRTTLSSLTPGYGGGGHAGGRCAISRTPPPPPLPQPPLFPKRKPTGTPLALVVLSSKYPPFPTPPPPSPKYNLWKKSNHLLWGSLESKLDTFRSIEDQVSSGRVTVNCGRSTRANSGVWGLKTGRMACCIFSLHSHDYRADSGIPLETISRPTQFQLPIFHITLGVGAWGGWKVPGSSSQVCSRFTSLWPHFRTPWYTNNSKMIKSKVCILGAL